MTDEGGDAPDPQHLGVRAFELVAPPDGLSFRFTSRIPRARGLGSSAAVIALGLVAGCRVAGRDADPEELLALGAPLEGHDDNLAACLAGGVCLTWERRIARIADAVPAVAIAVVPGDGGRDAGRPRRAARRRSRTPTPRSPPAGPRSSAPPSPPATRISSPPRSPTACTSPIALPGAPLFDGAPSRRRRAGALGTTISGSGPTVIVWASEEAAEACEAEVKARLPHAQVLRLAVSPHGAATA